MSAPNEIPLNSSPLEECQCPVRYSIERHGNGYALYKGRCCHKHGYNLAFITETDKETLVLIEASLNKMLKEE